MTESSPTNTRATGGGASRADAPADSAAPLGYNGQLHEPGACWQFLGNGYRVYNPVLMRFHSPDSLSPFGDGGINAYAYCAGDPVNHTDPSGHFLVPLAAFMGIGAVGVGAAAGVMAVQGKSREAGILGAIAGVLGAASMVAGGVVAFRSTGAVPFKPQGALVIKQRRRHVAISVHGGQHGTAVGNRALDGTQASAVFRQHGVDGQKKIKFLSCYSADGEAPQGQVVSNAFKVRVKAYSGKVVADWSKLKAVGPRKSTTFYPQQGAEREATAIRNTELHQQRWGGYRGGRYAR